jgi:hypothetical protein
VGDENLWSGAVCLIGARAAGPFAATFELPSPLRNRTETHQNRASTRVSGVRSVSPAGHLRESGGRESNPRSQLGKKALQEIRRDLLKGRKVQLNDFRAEPLLFATTPCLSLRVARNGSETACCTLLHGGVFSHSS